MSEQTPAELRALDAEVATQVMGWRRLTYAEAYPSARFNSGSDRLTLHWHDPVSLKGAAPAEPIDDYYDPEDAWSPSTDIAAAWLVVEKMRERGWWVTIKATPRTYFVEMNNPDVVSYTVKASGDAVATALCRAALAAVRGKEGQA